MAASACGPLVVKTEIKGSATVPGNPTPLGTLLGALPVLNGLTQMDFNTNQDFQNAGVTKLQVSSAKVERFRLQIVSPNTQDFGFLDSITFAIQANGQSATIAQKSGIRAQGLTAPNPTLELDLVAVELKPFIQANTTTIGMSGSGNQPAEDTQLEAIVDIRAEFKL